MKLYSLITGSGGLLGKYHSEALLQIGHNIVMTDLNLQRLKKNYFELKKNYPNAQILIYKMNVTSSKSVNKIINSLNKKKIIINNLINNAAIDAKYKLKFAKDNKFENITINKWDKELEVGLTGYMICSQKFGNIMVKKKIKGNILNIGSDLSVIAPDQRVYEDKKIKDPFVKPVTYSVIKHGIVGLTKYIATYWAKKNIRCNCLSPGSVLNNQSKNLQKKLRMKIPLGRLARKDEYIGAIKFLCSSNSNYMTGHNLIIDGGRSIW